MKKIFLILLIICFVLILLISLTNIYKKTYKNIFRLSKKQVADSLITTAPKCTKIKDCQLLPGDILIERYITNRTKNFDRFANPYYTHSGFYIGKDQIVEASGTEKNKQDEILIRTFSQSDWVNFVTDFVIIRPKYNSENQLSMIMNNLVEIANDTEYRFGLPEKNKKSATCADLIVKQLVNNNVLANIDQKIIVTPDYLFWLAKNNLNIFETIGYNLPE